MRLFDFLKLWWKREASVWLCDKWLAFQWWRHRKKRTVTRAPQPLPEPQPPQILRVALGEAARAHPDTHWRLQYLVPEGSWSVVAERGRARVQRGFSRKVLDDLERRNELTPLNRELDRAHRDLAAHGVSDAGVYSVSDMRALQAMLNHIEDEHKRGGQP